MNRRTEIITIHVAHFSISYSQTKLHVYEYIPVALLYCTPHDGSLGLPLTHLQ
jgi:hypothetical protein